MNVQDHTIALWHTNMSVLQVDKGDTSLTAEVIVAFMKYP